MTIEEYIEQHSSKESEILKRITHDTNVYQLNPHMLSGQVQGRLLSMFSKMIQPKFILEVGTFTGYSALCLAEGLTTDGLLHTIEKNDELEDTIRQNLSLSPLGKQIVLHIGAAIEILEQLNKDNKVIFDLVFIDADKREYCEYYELIMPMVKSGGFILADNTLWDGHITDIAYNRDKQTIGIRQFNDMIAADERVEKVILPLRDGLTIIRKK